MAAFFATEGGTINPLLTDLDLDLGGGKKERNPDELDADGRIWKEWMNSSGIE